MSALPKVSLHTGPSSAPPSALQGQVQALLSEAQFFSTQCSDSKEGPTLLKRMLFLGNPLTR